MLVNGSNETPKSTTGNFTISHLLKCLYGHSSVERFEGGVLLPIEMLSGVTWPTCSSQMRRVGWSKKSYNRFQLSTRLVLFFMMTVTIMQNLLRTINLRGQPI